MSARLQTMPKDELRRVLERADVPHDLINEILDQLPDPVDFDRNAAVLDRYGFTRTRLTDILGGSP
jgi:hypothetical protein